MSSKMRRGENCDILHKIEKSNKENIEETEAEEEKN